jgi:hypothetical protein
MRRQNLFRQSFVTLTAAILLGMQWPARSAGISAPVLKWSRGGCYSSWCETGWYSSPALTDVNRDGRKDVIASAYSLVALDGRTGQLLWRAGSTANRTWPGVVVADLDRNGAAEIVTAQSGGVLTVYDLAGNVRWQRTPTSSELRGLAAADLDGNQGPLELIVTAAGNGRTNTFVYDSNGFLRSGWPQLPSDGNGSYASGVYNANAAVGNLDQSDGRLEIVVPSDVHYISAYKPDGSQLKANAASYPGRQYWGQVGVWESLTTEQRGWGACSGDRAERYRANFADGPAVIADLDGNGTRELVVTGNMYDCLDYSSRYTALSIFNKDRTRFKTDAYDWSSIPTDTGAPIAEDYAIIETAEPNPVVADLDNDGKKEVLFSSYDGRVHAFWLDKAEHGWWPHSVQPAEGFYAFASEPTVADLGNDGQAEVIVVSWLQKGSYRTGKLHILSSYGQPLHEVALPSAVSGSWNGSLAAPTLGNIDGDRDLEVVINTAASGVVAYDLPGTAGSRILWGTGRGDYLRKGAK